MEKIWLSLAKMSGKEEAYIREAFETNWVTPLGPNVDGFESDINSWLTHQGCPDAHVTALASGTSAIHLALVMLNIGRGDEVICQSFTFAASANPICYVGATPVFVDSEPGTWNIDPDLLEEAIVDRKKKTGKLPRAIIAVHLYGTPACMNRITEIARRYEIPFIEDAAEAMGSIYDGKPCGTIGDYGIFSFNGNKMITTSGGGALISHNKADADKAKFYATQAREPFPYYQHEKIGYNYRMSNISAGIGRGQMHILDNHIARRRVNHNLYVEKFKDIAGITVKEPQGDATMLPNYWLTCIEIDNTIAGTTRDELSAKLAAANIESRPLWKPMHMQPVFAEAPAYTNGTSEKTFEQGLCLPSGPVVTDDDIDYIINIIKK
ncbi:MAG: DegT/DnrJ/EryC1/StrS family aminotransferase [Bacteroidaceae bacterium]|nr:DegT/DnrJ/EryC1/StrS family aminotransferase [Bacteroidaceae bacterium]